MDEARASGSVTALAFAVGLVTLLVAGAEVAVRYTPSTWIQRDGRFYTNVNVTLTESGSLVQDAFAASWYEGELGWNRDLDAGWSNVARGRDGHRLPKHPILLPLLATPFFWAFGLPGTLLFNLLLIGVAGGAAFLVARRYGSVSGAAFAGIGLVLATGIRDHVYDYHVDVLILALFTAGMACALARRGFWAGLLVGAAVAARPTVLLWLPSLVLLLVERRDWRALRRAILGGAIPLLLFALSNWWLYGAPWWSGYNRVLVLVAGEPQIADVSNAFGVPFDEGLRTLWSGPYGVRTRLPLLFAAAWGLLLLVRRRPLYVLSAVLGVTASVLLFAKYRWYGDRFLWPSCALLAPALGVSLSGFARAFRHRPEWRPAFVAAAAAALLVGIFAVVGAPVEARFEGGWSQVGLALFAAAALGFGTTRSAQRAVGGPLVVAAPLVLLLLPGVRSRVLALGPDVWFAVAVTLSLGARRSFAGLGFACVAAVVAGTAVVGELGFSELLSRLSLAPSRPTLLLAGAALLGLPLMGRRRWFCAPLLLLALSPVAALAGGQVPLFALALLTLPTLALAQRGGRAAHGALRSSGSPGKVLGALSVLGALVVTGVVARASEGPFQIASYRGVRSAQVHLGEIPCDFLAWEHLNWECATFDRGVRGETGLCTSQPLMVAGQNEGLFLISTQRGRPRTVRWSGLSARSRLRLRWAVPDGLRGGGRLTIRIDDEELETIALPARPDGRVYERAFDTTRFDGREVALTLELQGSMVAVGLDGGFSE